MSELNENDNLDINTGETGGTPQENTGAAQPSGQSGDGEYHYVKPETTRLYADADYVRQDETTVPPRYYVPPEKTQAKPRRAKVKGSGSGLWWKVACLCLVCALLGGIAGGALAGTSLAKKLSGTAATTTSSPSGSGTSTVTASKTGTMTPAQIYDMACKQVVGIQSNVTYANFFGQTTTAAVSGTGFFISTDGYILTNYHVIEDAYTSNSTITVLTHDGTSYKATVTGVESSNDLAVLKIDATGCSAVTFGDSDSMSVGDTVYAVGNPMGELQFTMTSGMVSALDRAVTTDEYTTAINMFQFDAAINEGNSGGPVYNTKGEVVGIVTAKYASTGVEGLGFAIPINNVSDIVDQLIKQGYVSGQSSLGITVKTVDSAVAQYYNMVQGAYVDSVNAGSCSEKAGVKKGDIITALNDKQITSTSDLASAKKNYKAGETVTLKIYRSGAYQELKVTLDEEKNTGSTSSSGSVTQQLPSVPKAST